ncbi:MAG: FtsH protease activity modulator HflK [bacterium]
MVDWDEFQKRRKGRGPLDGIPKLRIPKFNLPGFKMPRLPILIAILAIMWLATGIYIVAPDEKGVVMRFGKWVATTGPGPHYHLPSPIETVLKPKVTEVKRIEVGFRTIDQGPPARYSDVPRESLMLTGDENILDIDIIVQYRILDPGKFLFNIRDPHVTVRVASEAALREVIGANTIDEALTVGKFAIQENTKRLLQQILDSYGSGLQIVAVQLQDVHPPDQVREAFRDVASAKEDKIRLINEAEGYRNAILPETRGRAAQIVNNAEAYMEEKILKAKGDADRFKSVLAEYEKAKDITRTRLYLETMEEILPEMDKFLLGGDSGSSVLPILPLGKGSLTPR